MTTETYKPGDLVASRGREWVVMPGTTPELVMVRPLGGLDDETTGIMPVLETIEPATFDDPDPNQLGDQNACRLLRDAARLSTRAASGPFRAFGRIAVEPRPYQLVPLMMAMKLDPVRLLIADDVGIGKTVEACLIAKELLERGEADGLAVVCPPHLAEQWQRELKEKFHIDAELVLRSTVRRLERGQRHAGESLFARHRFVVVSADYIKADKRIDDFINNCPNLVIVDEAHTCTLADASRSGRQQRHSLVKRLSDREDSHLLLVTATPHSGNESAFQSLVGLLDEEFADLPEDLEAKGREAVKRRLARHLVQRKRDDVKNYLGITEFPTALESEETYRLSDAYRAFLMRVVRFARQLVTDKSGSKVQQRVRWWSALGLMRALASSPAAASATLRNRAANLAAKDETEADEIGRRAILDDEDSEQEQVYDFTPGSDGQEALSRDDRKQLKELAEIADSVRGDEDAKLKKVTGIVKKLVKEGHAPILFCRFIDTADYVAEHLRHTLRKVDVASITGSLAPSEREARIAELGASEHRVLVCTDCLSEGVNLQEHFDTVLHYDLSWNPTRHEQREGRVDRFGQPRDTVKILTLYGQDNLIDVVILNVLLRKHQKIRSRLGVSVSLPASTNEVIEQLYHEVINEMQEATTGQMRLDFRWSGEEDLHTQWEERAEKISRSVFAQKTIEPSEVESELTAIRRAIGDGPTVERFLKEVFGQLHVPVNSGSSGRLKVNITGETPRSVRNAIGRDGPFVGRVDLPVEDPEIYLARTHPIVEGLASWVLDTALDPVANRGRRPLASRCGVSVVDGIDAAITILLLRLRHHLRIGGRGDQAPMLAEEILPVGFSGEADSPIWLEPDIVEFALGLPPVANVDPMTTKSTAGEMIAGLTDLREDLECIANKRAESLLEAHTRVRESARAKGKVTVEPVLPVDVLGAYALLPRVNTS